MSVTDLSQLSDAHLIARLAETCAEGSRLTARIVVYLGEVEVRRLDLRAACTSMFDFCVRRLGMSEGAAYRRIVAARLVRRFPSLLGPIERGELHLSTLAVLRPHLTDENVEALIAKVLGKSHREVLELLAAHAPRPPSPSRVVPLSEALFEVKLTASKALRDKLERARDLMRHRNPSGDLAVIVERALDELLEKLETERRPCPAASRRRRSTKAGTVARAVRREVFERDGEQCTFCDEHGERCPARTFLEIDHVTAKALGGSDEASNLRLRCRAHNQLHAEDVFGQDHVARQRSLRRRRSSASAIDTRAMALLDSHDAAMRGLLHLGFARPEAQRALDSLSRRHANDAVPLPIEQVLREAVSALT